MAQVHPTAILDGDIELADDVAVGPQCVLEGRIKIGPGTKLLHRVTLRGPLVIGRGNVFYPNAAVGLAPQDRKFDPNHDGAGVVIGDENLIREGATIHRATKDRPTTLGHRNYLMVNTHVAHDDVVGNDCTFANGSLLAGHVEVADGVIFGGNAAVQQFTRVGRLCMISGGAVTPQDVPPFCTVYISRRVGSLNIIGLRRGGFRDNIENLKRAFHILFRSRLSRGTAVGRITAELGHDPLCAEFAAFVAASKRGITAYGGSSQEE